MSLKKLITKITGTAEQIETILNTGTGTITLDTTTFTDLNEFNVEFWQFHCPYGNPGDELWLTEDYRISQLCQTNDGYIYTIEFKNGGEQNYQSVTTSSLTPKNQWVTGNESTPEYAIRCKTVITNIIVSENKWIITLSLLIP